MKVMVVGSGGREYSIGLALKKDPNVSELFFAPGNGATPQLGHNVTCKDYEALADFAKENKIDLTVVGPETALVEGIVDIFKAKGLVIFGASKAAAR
ncbi:MAG: phosphoribosylamine--glycine ligase, partial [Campylobacterales bacterium]|nr:phosphoribosylamine--glycine ligase [Campylobacterales bacterium]